jgi:hypothetical protein
MCGAFCFLVAIGIIIQNKRVGNPLGRVNRGKSSMK